MKLRILVALALIAIPRFAVAQQGESVCWQSCLDQYVYDKEPDPGENSLILHADEMTDSQLETMAQSAIPGGVSEWAKTQLANRMNDEWTVAWMLSFRVYKNISPSERKELEKEVIRRYFAVATNPNLEETLLSHVSKENCTAVIQDYLRRFPEKGGTPLALYNQFLATSRYRGNPSPVACSEVLFDVVVPTVTDTTADPEKLVGIAYTAYDWDKLKLANQAVLKAIAIVENDYFMQKAAIGCQDTKTIESYVREPYYFYRTPRKPYSQDVLQKVAYLCYQHFQLSEYDLIQKLKNSSKGIDKKINLLDKARNERWNKKLEELRPPPATAEKKETRN